MSDGKNEVYVDALFFSIASDLYQEDKATIGLAVMRFQALDLDEKSYFFNELDKCKSHFDRRQFIEEYFNLDDFDSKKSTIDDDYNPYSYKDSYQVTKSLGKLPADMFKENPWDKNVLSKAEVPVVIETKPNKKKYKSMEDLNDLVGLEKVKDQINELVALTEINRLRGQHNLKSDSQGLHMMFKGNPGTGKTTVARLLGKILHEIGVLEKGHVVEIDRSSLVSMYQGEIERKMTEFVEQAIGGILFIDEIYSLFDNDKGDDQGKHGVTTLLKLIEDKRGQLICIGAGYTSEVDTLLGSNPGLKSRFSIHLNFEDYTEDQLLNIANDMFEKQDYSIDEDFKDLFAICMEQEKETKNFGNGRVVRNIVESAIRKQSIRLFNSDKDLNKDDLITIIGEDFKYVSIVLENEAS